MANRADVSGRETWIAATRSGQNVPAARPADVRALGVRALASASAANASSSYGALKSYVPSATKIAANQREQEEIAAARRDFDRRNGWLPAIAVAPFAAGLALDAGLALVSRIATRPVKPPPLIFPEPAPPIRGGDTAAARAGRTAHANLRERVEAKPGWEYEPRYNSKDGRLLKPDVGTPARNPANPKRRYILELKPNTESGRDAARSAVKRYKEGTENKTRAIFYDPKDFM